MQARTRKLTVPAWILIFAPSGLASAEWTTVIDSGPSANRVDLVIMGDGYTASDIAAGTYAAHVDDYLNYLFADTLNSAPFHRYRNYFNVHSIEVVSPESGADIPPEDVFRNTALDATYYADGATERLLSVSVSKARTVRDQALEEASFAAEMQLVTVNSTKYGGAGGPFATFAGGSGSSSEIALHELAHSFSNLADEYGGIATTYTGPEPTQVNLTTDPTGAKWSHWLGYNEPGVGTIGAYEGGGYHNMGLYRPSINSKMRSLNQPFDAVSREKIVLDIYALVDPIDSWTDNSITLVDPMELAVTPIDAGLIQVEWYVDGSIVSGATSAVLDLAALSLNPGSHTVAARAFDPTGFDQTTGWVRQRQESLEQWITWSLSISGSPQLAGDFNGDNRVDNDDYTHWKQVFGQTVSPATSADGNGDGLVNLADYNVWRDNLGGVSPTTALTFQTAEPATLEATFAALALACTLYRRDRATRAANQPTCVIC